MARSDADGIDRGLELAHDVLRRLEEYGYTEIWSKRVTRFAAELRRLGVRKIDVWLAKLLRAVATPAEFRGILAEGWYGWQLAKGGAAVVFEPNGAAGPDLGVRVAGEHLLFEIKRMLAIPGSDNAELQDWYENEASPNAVARGKERPTLKVLDRVKSAKTQLTDGEANFIILHDFSLDVTRSHFLDAMASLLQEANDQGTYRSLAGVYYHSTFTGSGIASPNCLWLNPLSGAVLPDAAVAYLERALAVDGPVVIIVPES